MSPAEYAAFSDKLEPVIEDMFVTKPERIVMDSAGVSAPITNGDLDGGDEIPFTDLPGDMAGVEMDDAESVQEGDAQDLEGGVSADDMDAAETSESSPELPAKKRGRPRKAQGE